MAEDNSSPPQGSSSTVNLQIVSPSVGVPQPLILTNIATTTTVSQLKEKIQETLTLRPSADEQRLIYRGRLLARDEETLSDIFRSPVGFVFSQVVFLGPNSYIIDWVR
jgi:hypothetical protein